MKEGIVVYGFPACGKTTLFEKYSNSKTFIDLESSNYQYILTKKQMQMPVEARKGTIRKVNPEWPNNYFKAIMESVKKYDFVFVAHTGIVWCAENNIPYWRIFPDYSCKEEYLKRMKDRGNSEHFLNSLEVNFDKYIEECYNDDKCERKIVLHKGEFIEDAFRSLHLL